MLGQLRSKFTYANVMATLAFFLALGGVSYAATHINGHRIEKHSIPANRLVRGRAAVLLPSGKKRRRRRRAADVAATAGTSGTSPLVTLSVGQAETLFTSGPFTFTATCEDLGGGDFKASVNATSTEGGWIGGSGYPDNVTPRPAGSSVVADSVHGTTRQLPEQLGNEVFAAPSGAAVVLGGFSLGVHVLSSDCLFNVYAVGG